MDTNKARSMIDNLYNATVFDQDGEKIGKVGQVFLDDNTQQPTWVTVKTGLFGTNETFVPLKDAQITSHDINVPFSKDFIKDAPNVDADHHLSEREEDELYRYYDMNERGIDNTGETTPEHPQEPFSDDEDHYTKAGSGMSGAGLTDDYRDDEGRKDRELDSSDRLGYVDDSLRDDPEYADYDEDHRENKMSDNTMTLHEEQLNVHTEREKTGQVRLRKHVVTENQTVEVPVTREEVHVVREPVDNDHAIEDVTDITDDYEDDVVIDMYEERPVVEKETVAKERVGLDKGVVRDEQTITDEVSHEEAEIVRSDGHNEYMDKDEHSDETPDHSLGDHNDRNVNDVCRYQDRERDERDALLDDDGGHFNEPDVDNRRI